jgi:hypothetical protein
MADDDEHHFLFSAVSILVSKHQSNMPLTAAEK